MAQENRIIVHATGGAGISISDKVITKIADYGDGFANIVFKYLDTSTANISKIEPRGEFIKIESETNSKGKITGSGGERSTHAVDIMKAVDKYLDANKYTKPNPHEFHVVVFSGSGGSGNVIGTSIIKRLLSAGIPTVAVMVGDSSTGMMAINTLNVIASLNKIALDTKKTLSTIYVNNHGLSKGTMKDSESEANKLLFSYLSGLALFLSSENEYMDNQDMVAFLDMGHYKKLDIKPGLYGLMMYSKTIILPEGVKPLGGRTLTLENGEYDTGLDLAHHKYGFVTDEEAQKLYDNQFPIHLISMYNFFEKEEARLKAITAKTFQDLSNVEEKTVTGTANSDVDDETGLIL